MFVKMSNLQLHRNGNAILARLVGNKNGPPIVLVDIAMCDGVKCIVKNVMWKLHQIGSR